MSFLNELYKTKRSGKMFAEWGRNKVLWMMALRWFAFAGVLLYAATGWADPAAAPSATAPPSSSSSRWDGAHPAVARIIVTLSDGMAYGSGTLVGADAQHGLVITNWHVVRDAAGPIMVVFPDGFRSAASVLKMDRDWDLAALAIWRPHVDPVPISPYPIPPGEPLTIAGYGPGWYRASTGRCMQYFAPASNFPREIVELSTPARQGDSGGPIFNNRGEIAGVLFGTADGNTMGSYGGRVRAFLESAVNDFRRLNPAPNNMIAQQTPSPAHPATMVPAIPAPPVNFVTQTPVPVPAVATQTPRVAVKAKPARPSPPPEPEQATVAVPSASTVADSGSNSITWADFAGSTRSEQAKTVLAIVGGITLLLQTMRFFAVREAPPKRKR